MFVSTINSFLKQASLDEKLLNLELLAYNFHETMDLKPLFADLERQITTDQANSGKKIYLDRLTTLARNITRSQMIVLEEDGQKKDLSIDLGALPKSPGGINLEPVNLNLNGIQRSFLLTVTGVDKNTHELQCRLAVNIHETPDTTFADLSVGFYDFPMIENTQLTHDQRCTVVLNHLKDDSADVTLLLFPGSRASFKERPFYEDVIRNLQKPTASGAAEER